MKGFTFVEVIVVVGMVATLLGLAIVNLGGFQRKAYLDSTITTLLADIKQQQLKAMTGDTEGRGARDAYGIYFQSTSYTLFHGSNYLSSDTSNFKVNLDNNIQFTAITLPSSRILFASGSGDLVGYSGGANTFGVTNTTNGEVKTVTINKYGAIISVN